MGTETQVLSTRAVPADGVVVRTVIPIVFYTWLVVSTVVFVKRRVDGSRAKRAAQDQLDAARDGRNPAATEAAVLSRLARSTGPPAVDATADEGPDVHPPAIGAVGEAEPDAEARAQFRTLADMVRGIALPCDLTPQLDPSRGVAADRAAFTTTTHSATDVDAGLRIELARLGLDTFTPTSSGYVAAGERGRLEVRLYPTAAHAVAAGITSFAPAPPDAVAVELLVR